MAVAQAGRWMGRRIGVIAGTLAAATAIFVVGARLSRYVALLAMPGGALPLPAWASVALILSTVGLVAVILTPPRQRLRAWASAASVLLVASSVLSLVQHVGGWPPEPEGPSTGAFLWVPVLFYAGAVLLVLAHGIRTSLADVFGSVSAAMSVALFLGFACGVPLTPRLGWHAPSLFAAVGVFFLGCSFIGAAGTSAWSLQAFRGEAGRSLLLRWFVPFTLLAIGVIDRLTFQTFARISPTLGSTVTVTASLTAAATVAYHVTDLIGGRIDRAEQRMNKSEKLRRVLKRYLRTNEELFRVAFQTSADAMSITRLDDGVYVAVNRGFTELSGWTESDTVGRTSAEINLWVDRTERTWALEQIARDGQIKDLETRLRRRDGSEFIGQLVVQRFELDGRPHLLTVTRDVTSQRRLEREAADFMAALKRAGDEWRTTFDNVDAAVMVIDPATEIVTRMNLLAAKLAGRRPQDRPSLRDLDCAEPWKTIAEALNESRGHHRSVLKNATDNQKTWLVALSRPQGWPGSGGEAIVVLVRDVTEVVTLRDSLRRSDAMSAIGSLVSGVAHQVRNPIFGMSATLDVMELRCGADCAHEPYLHALRRELDRVNSLMRDLLQYGRPLDAKLAPDAVASVVGVAASCCEPLAALTSVRIDNRVGPDAGLVAMDGERLVHVFQNLIENAIQHSPRGGEVTVDARRFGKHVAVRVFDSGPGFRTEDLPRIFEPFFSRRRDGTGLGLSIAQRIVEQHRGTLEAANRPEGGASMTVFLPT